MGSKSVGNSNGRSPKPEEPNTAANPGYERQLLGSLLLGGHPDQTEVLEGLPPETFWIPVHRRVFDAMRVLDATGSEIDPIAVIQIISAEGNLGSEEAAYICGLTAEVPKLRSLANLTASLQRLRRIRRYQTFVRAMNALLESATVTEQEFLTAAGRELSNLEADADLEVQVGRTYRDAGLGLMVEILDRDTPPVVLSTGIVEVDELIGGIVGGEVVVVTADTGVGKTLFAQQIRARACADHHHALYCSAEMLAGHLVGREVAARAQVPHWKLRRPERITQSEVGFLSQAVTELCEVCHIMDAGKTGELSLAQIRAATRRLQREKNLRLLIVDYDELVVVPGKDEWEQQKNLIRALKALAMQLGIAVIMISQLRKPLSGDDRKKPRLQSLYGTGAKTKHASIVIYVDREYVRELDGDETKAEIFVLKSRDGRVGRVECRFDIHRLQFHGKKKPEPEQSASMDFQRENSDVRPE